MALELLTPKTKENVNNETEDKRVEALMKQQPDRGFGRCEESTEVGDYEATKTEEGRLAEWIR
jgi:hypothetical protein